MSESDLLRGFGAFKGTDIPERMREEHRRLQEEWRGDDTDTNNE